MILIKILYKKGQAAIEYLLIMAFVVGLTVKTVGSFSDFFRDSMGNLGDVLTRNLLVGVCPKDCFFAGFKNGPKE